MKHSGGPQVVAPGNNRRGIVGAGIALGITLCVAFGWRILAAPAATAATVTAVAAVAAVATVAEMVPAPAPAPARSADFGKEEASDVARQLAAWIAASRDNGDMAFLIVDKKYARVFTFDAHARLQGTSPILLGSALGDESVPGIGTRPIAKVRPFERTTPAGRFVAERGRNAQGEDVIWVDYDAAVSMHRVRTGNSKERRLERLATSTNTDNRISYGCINVPVAFYESHIRPVFATRRALVYVLPEIKTLQQVFSAFTPVPLSARVPH